jgi:proline racemase
MPGDTILAKRRWAREHLDHVRRALILEPRGHADMYGAYLTEPVTPAADLGVVFMHNEGYSDMCGHGIIALATVAVAHGLVARSEPETRVGIDTPRGLRRGLRRLGRPPRRRGALPQRRVVPAHARPHGEHAVVRRGDGRRRLRRRLLRLPRGRAGGVGGRRRRSCATSCRPASRSSTPSWPPPRSSTRSRASCAASTAPSSRSASPTASAEQRNVCVFADREVDRSPTGTGTAGRVAQLVARGALALGEPLRNASIVGSVFTGTALERTTVGPFEAVVPEVEGRAAITGHATWLVERGDALGDGFFLR